MSIGLDAVNLEQAVRDAEVSRSSAYAVWSSEQFSPQEEFQRRVLIAAVEDRKQTLVDLTETVGSIYLELVDTMPSRQVLRELIRRAAKSNVEVTSQSMSWKIVIALRAILHSTAEDERDEELVAWMNESAVAMREFTIEKIYKPLAETTGVVPRPQYGERAYELGEICSSAMSEGFSMRYWTEALPNLDGLPHPRFDDGKEWSMYALLFEQVVEMFFVPASGCWDDLN